MLLNLKRLFKKLEKLLSKPQWKKLFSVLNKKEKVLLGVFVFCFVVSGVFLVVNFYFLNTKPSPAIGGTYTEGIVGQPRIINPLYLSTQDVDRDIVEIIFSGLMKYDENGQIIKDLVKDYSVKEQGRVFEITLKENAKWHDEKPLTSDDVIFTVHLIQNPEYQSPLRIKWAGVIAERIDEKNVAFRLPKKYAGFLETLTIKILPKHIFENVAPQNLPLSLVSEEYLIGSGPFKLEKVVHEQSGYVKKIILERNKNYYGQKPFIKKFSFAFFKDEKELKKSVKLGEVDGFNIASPGEFKNEVKNFKVYTLTVPRYFAVFFNVKKDGVLSNENIKTALLLAINKQEIIENVFAGKAQEVNSPILPAFFGFKSQQTAFGYDLTKAQELVRQVIQSQQVSGNFTLDLTQGSKGKEVEMLQQCLAKDKNLYPDGEISGVFGPKTKEAVIKFQEKYSQEILAPSNLTKGNGVVKAKTREKLNAVCFEPKNTSEKLPIILTTCDKFPLPEISQILKKQWEAAGFEVSVEKVSLADLQNDVLSKHNFSLLLFGEALSAIPDPFPFWHSSQKEYPGLNIAGYSSKAADGLLEKAREAQDEKERQENLEKFQDVLTEDMPAIFLVRPDYVYTLSDKIKGFDVTKIVEPAKRFSNIEQWYIKTKRAWR